jgi:hypothetical protein
MAVRKFNPVERKVAYAAVKVLRNNQIELVVVPVSMPVELANAALAGMRVEQVCKAVERKVLSIGPTNKPATWAEVSGWYTSHMHIQTISFVYPQELIDEP